MKLRLLSVVACIFFSSCCYLQTASAVGQQALQDAWMGEILSQLSPKVSEMGTRLLNSRVEPLVQGAISALNLGKKAFKFTRINLGQVRPQLNNIRTHRSISDLNRITVDFDMVYRGDGDIQVAILGVSSGVRNVMLGGRARLVMTPTMSQLPMVGGLQLFFITKPEIDFDFDGLAKVADLPLIKAKIKEDLLKDIMEQAVYPNRVTIPLSWTADPMMIWQPQVTGILGVRLRTVKNLPRKGGTRKLFGQDKPDVYGMVGVGGKEWRTPVAKNTMEAVWEEWYEFPLEEMDGHVVEVNMYDKDHTSSDEFLGYAAVDVKNFMQQCNLMAGCPVSSGGRATQPGSTPLPATQPMQSQLVTATLQNIPGRKSKYTTITGEIGVELAWQPLSPTPGPATSRLFPGSTTAFLTVFIYSANNLVQYSGGAPLPAGYLPSAKATVTVANYTETSPTVRDSQQASLNMGATFSLPDTWRTASLTVTVEDTEKRGGLFGKVVIPLSTLVGVDKEKEILQLDPAIPSQTLTISAKIRFPSVPSTTG